MSWWAVLGSYQTWGDWWQCLRLRGELFSQTPFLLGWSWAWLTQSCLHAHLSPSFRTTCFGLPDLANKNRDAQLNLDFR